MVAVATEWNILEMATRAKRELILILAEPEEEKYKEFYQMFQMWIKAAEDEGLVDLQVSESESNFTIIMIMITILPYSTPPEIDPKPAGDREPD